MRTINRIYRVGQLFVSIHGIPTWSRRVTFLRAARLCHSCFINPSLKYQTDTVTSLNQPEGRTSLKYQTDTVTSLNQPQDNRSEQLQVSPTEVAERDVVINPGEQFKHYVMKPDQPPDARVLRVAILGAPNAGKSTLVNNLLRWKVNPVSLKVHTTRKNTFGVITKGNTQIVFTDTPGVITAKEKKKHYCDKSMLVDPKRSLEEVDLVGVLVDVSNYFTRTALHREILKILEDNKHIPSVLILNKVDLLKRKDVLLDITNRLTAGMVGGTKVPVTFKRKQPKKIKEESANTFFEKLENKYGTIPAKEKLEEKLDNRKLSLDKSVKVACDEEVSTVSDNDSEDGIAELTKGENNNAISTEQNVLRNSEMNQFGEFDISNISKNFIHSNNNIDKDITNSNSDSLKDIPCDIVHPSGPSKEICRGSQEATLHAQKQATNDSHHDNIAENNEIISKQCKIEESSHSGEFEELINESVTESINKSINKSDNKESKAKEINSTGSSANSLSKKEAMDEFKELINESVTESIDKSINKSNNETIDKESNDKEINSTGSSANSSNKHEAMDKRKLESSVKDIEEKKIVEIRKTDWSKLMPREEKVQEGWSGFNEVFMLSSLHGEGVGVLKDYLLRTAKEGDWVFHSSCVTMEDPFELATQCVWSKILDHVEGYVAYKAVPEITYWQVDENDLLKIVMNVPVRNVDRLIGKGGHRIKTIATEAEQALMDAFRCEVKLKLIARRKKNI